MANATTFPISKPIVLPHPSTGFLVFTPSKHAFGYRVFPDPGAKSVKIDLLIVDKITGNKVWELRSFNVTESGFLTDVILNAAEISAWESTAAGLKSDVATNSTTVDSKRVQEREFLGRLAEKQDVRAGTNDEAERAILAGEIDVLIGQVNDVQKELADAETAAETAQVLYLQHVETKPIPQPLIVNRYSDVIGYFNGDGSITKEGIEWAGQVPFLDGTLGDYLATK